jgi:YesN/AraC family two-component response regulator
MIKEEIKLLVVDDLEMVREGVAFHFQQKGYIVFTADSAEQALSVIMEEERLDIIITDISLPGMSGLELIKLLRKFNTTVKIIVVSGHRLCEHKEEQLKEFNIRGYIAKPFTFEELESAFSKALNFPEEGGDGQGQM